MSQEEEQGRKRGAARQLTDRDEVDDTVESEAAGTWKKADAATMQNRKIFKVRGGKGSLERSGSGSGSDIAPTPATTTPASTGPFFSFANKEEAPAVSSEKKEEATNGTNKPATPTKAEPSAEASVSTTPAKEAPSTPTKEATTPSKEGGSSTTTTPAKEASTPTKETTQATTPAKEDAPKAAEGTPEAPKAPAFSTPTSFSFPTSFSSTSSFSFPTLSSTTLPAFPASNTPFSGFNFPTVNFSAGGSSVFSAGGAKKEGSDDEGDEGAYNPEEEVAVNTAPSKLPVVPTVTGEEDEKTLHTVRAKLYAMIEGKWQERGVGNLKLNEGKDGKCRLLMRDEKGKHLRLNTALFSEMKVDKSGDKSVQFVAVGTGGGDAPVAGPAKAFTTYAVRVGRKEEAEELYEAIQKHKGTAENAST